MSERDNSGNKDSKIQTEKANLPLERSVKNKGRRYRKVFPVGNIGSDCQLVVPCRISAV